MKNIRSWLTGFSYLILIAVITCSYVYWPLSHHTSTALVQVKSPQVSHPSEASLSTSVSVKTASNSTSGVVTPTGSISATNPPIMADGEKPGEANIRVAGKSYHLNADGAGDFERIHIEPKQKIAVQVSYPQGEPGAKIIVEVVDGGHLDNKTIVQVQSLDAARSVAFNFQASDPTGIYRVTLRYGADLKELNFWAGPEPVFVKR